MTPLIGVSLDILCFLICYSAARGQQKVDADLWAVLSLNLFLTAVLSGNTLFVAVADVSCTAPLIFGPRRQQIVAALFLAMVPVYLAGWFFDWSGVTTLTIVALFAWVQWMVAGHVDGLPHYWRYSRRLGLGNDGAVAGLATGAPRNQVD